MNRPFYKLNVVAAAFLIIGLSANAQTNSVSIGTQSTNASAVLWLNSPNGNQGLIIPVGSRTSVTTPAKGMLIFDTNQVYAYDGTNWNTVGGGGGSSYSLSYNASTKIISLNPTTGTASTIDISTTTLSGGDLGGTLATPTVTGLQTKALPALPASLQYLTYDGVTGAWKFQSPSGGGDMLKATYDPTGKNADAFDLTKHTGVLPLANGGTGITSALTATQILTGNGTTNAATALTGDASINAGSLKVTGLQSKILPALPASLQYLVYDGTTSAWKFQTPASAALGNLTSTTTGITITGGTGAVSGTGTTVNIQNATTSQPGLLTAADWTTFNGKLGSATTAGGDLSGTFSNLQLVSGTITDADINASGITTAGKVSGNAITSGTIGGSTIINTSGDILSSGTGSLSVAGTTTFGGHKYTWPTVALAASTTYLSTDASGTLSWVTVPSPFSTNNTIPKGNGSGLTASSITDDGSTVTITNSASANVLDLINTGSTAYAELGIDGAIGSYLSMRQGGNQTAYMYSVNGGTYLGTQTPDPFNLTTAGNTRMTISSSGNVGVGIASPTEILDVNGPILLEQIATPATPTNRLYNVGGTLTWNGNALSGSSWGLKGNAGTTSATNFIGTTDANDFVIKTNNAEVARFKSTGDLGIGLSTAAQRKLALFDGGSNNNNQFIGFGVDPTGTLRYQVSVNVNDHVFYAGTSATTSNELMRITGTGNVGIGTPSPGSKLQVQNGTNAPGVGNGNIEVHTANGNGSAIYADFSTGGDGTGTVYSRGTIAGYDANVTGTNNTGVWGHQFDNGSGGWGVLASNGSSLTSPTTYAGLGGTSYPGIFMGGNVGVGTNAPSEAIHAYGTAGTSILVEDSPGAAGGATASLKLKAFGNVLFGGPVTNNYQISGSTILPFLSFSLNGSNLATMSTIYLIPGADNTMSIGGSSNRWTSVYAVNGTIQTSDIRLKSNIKPLNYGLSEVMKFNPVSYSWKDKKDSKKIGLIAQEVQKLVPEVVTEGEYLGMNYAELVPVLIKAVQEQQKLIDDQKKQIEELKAQQSQKETSAQSELNQLKAEVANIKKTLGMEASTKKK